MSQLVKDLKNEHLVIAKSLNQIRACGLDSEECLLKLASLEKILLAHLRKEDDFLYPVLEKVAESDSSLSILLAVFAQEMAEISKGAISFFERYASGWQGGGLEQEFSKLYSTIMKRIEKEDVIYKRYDLVMEASPKAKNNKTNS